MRFFSIMMLVAAAAAVSAGTNIQIVSGLSSVLSGTSGRVCYPSPCGTYTTDAYPANGTTSISITTSTEQSTPFTQYIGLDKFHTQGGSRQLTKVTLRTILKFQTSSYITCTGTVSYCRDEFDGVLQPGIDFKMDLASNPGLLPQYWGRWGDYPYGGTYTNAGTPPIPDTSMDCTDESNLVPMFVPYTYPLFDIIGFESEQQHDPVNNLCFISCSIWGYYKQSAKASIEFFYGDNTQGNIVSYDSNLNGGTGGYSQGYNQFLNLDTQEKPVGIQYQFGSGKSAIPTPSSTEVFLGTATYDIATAPTPIIKSISLSDPPGGINQNILPQTILNLFQTDNNNNASENNQLYFRVDAQGFVQISYHNQRNGLGRNAQPRHQTVAMVQMSCEYEYTTVEPQTPTHFTEAPTAEAPTTDAPTTAAPTTDAPIAH